MNTTLKRFVITGISLTGYLISGCISVSIQPTEFKESQGIRFAPPPPPFREVKTMESDRSWSNPKNGNTIAFVSECGSSSSDLKSIARSVIAPTKMKISKQTLDKNKSLVTEAKSDDENVHLRLVTKKTPSCIYNFAFVGRGDSFAADEKTFEQFLSGLVLE